MDRTGGASDELPSEVKAVPAKPPGGSVDQWEGEGFDGLPLEVHTDVVSALQDLQQRPSDYRRGSVVVHGSPSFLQETVKEVRGKPNLPFIVETERTNLFYSILLSLSYIL